MHLSTCWKGEKMFASRCTGSFPRLPTCNWQWRMTVQEEEDEEDEEPWLWLLLWVLWSVAAYAITFHSSNKVDNKQKCSQKKKKNLLPPFQPRVPRPKSQMQSVVGTMRCREGIQQILSIRFRYGFSSLPRVFFFTFFLIIFFLFVF